MVQAHDPVLEVEDRGAGAARLAVALVAEIIPARRSDRRLAAQHRDLLDVSVGVLREIERFARGELRLG
jgi:hypothetical protein